MLYTDGKKIYVKVSGNFIEVNISKDKKDGYNVVPIRSEKIEAYGNESKFHDVSIDVAYEMLNKKSNSKLFDIEKGKNIEE